MQKFARKRDGDKDALIDPEGYKDYIADRQAAIETDLKRQKGQ
jgi:hypothetical protein